MGIERIDYIMWAVDLGADNVNFDDFIDEIEGSPVAKFNIVYDGMCGEYAYAGFILLERDDFYNGFGKGIEITPLEDEFSSSIALQVMQAFPHLELTKNDFKLIVFSHFS